MLLISITMDGAMVPDVDKCVPPGETVIWRDVKDRSYHFVSRLRWLVPLVLIMLLVFRDTLDISRLDYVVIFLALHLVGMAMLLHGLRVGHGGPAIVTDRRIVQGDLDGDVTSVMLEHVASVRLLDGYYGLHAAFDLKTGNGPIAIRNRHAEELAAVVADRLGQTVPGRVGRLRNVYGLCRMLGLVLAVEAAIRMFFVYEVLAGIAPGLMMASWAGAAVTLLAFVGVTWLSWWLATHVLGFIALVFMPRYASSEEAENWLQIEMRPTPFTAFGWKRRPYRWLARLVYGRDLRVSADRSA